MHNMQRDQACLVMQVGKLQVDWPVGYPRVAGHAGFVRVQEEDEYVLLLVLAELLLRSDCCISGLNTSQHPLALVVPLNGAAPIDLAYEPWVEQLLLQPQHGAAVNEVGHRLLRCLEVRQDATRDRRRAERNPARRNRDTLHSF